MSLWNGGISIDKYGQRAKRSHRYVGLFSCYLQLILVSSGAKDNISATDSHSASASTIPSSQSLAPPLSQLRSHSQSPSPLIRAIAPMGPAHDTLSQFMSVQNCITEQHAQANRALMSELVNMSKKQTCLLEVGLDLIKSHSSSITIPPASPHPSALH